MLAFYRRLYPFKSIYNWLNHDITPSRLFTHREFAFTLPGDIYLRYNSFASADELKKQVCQLNPTRFEIGPIYSARVSLRAYRVPETMYIELYLVIAAEGQEDYALRRIRTHLARARLRYRYDRLRPHPYLLLRGWHL